MKIREATKLDVHKIFCLSKELQKDVVKMLPKELVAFDTIMSEERLLERIGNNEYLSLVVEDKDQIVGYCLNKIEANIDNLTPKQGKISEIYIAKNFRGKSIASKFYNEALKWFKKKGCKYIQLNVYDDNPAKDIYEKWGFKPFSINLKKKL
jgi:ribosomal protein S18 acetylase RimI-like enzyme